jgi:hypothetical protein
MSKDQKGGKSDDGITPNSESLESFGWRAPFCGRPLNSNGEVGKASCAFCN